MQSSVRIHDRVWIDSLHETKGAWALWRSKDVLKKQDCLFIKIMQEKIFKATFPSDILNSNPELNSWNVFLKITAVVLTLINLQFPNFVTHFGSAVLSAKCTVA